MIENRGSWIFNNGSNSGYLSGQYLVLERNEKHYFRKFHGFAVSRDVYVFARAKGVRYYEIHYRPEMEVLIFNLEDFIHGHKVMFTGELQYIIPKERAVMKFRVPSLRPQHMDPGEGIP